MFWVPDKLTNFVNWLGLSTETVPISQGALIILGQFAIGYLLTFPMTALMAKRGLFLGADRIWFPGWQDGDGAYQKEREIFGSVELRVREAPVDLWVFGILMLISFAVAFLTFDQTIAWWQSWSAQPSPEGQFYIQMAPIRGKSSLLLFISSVSLLPPSAERDWVGPKFNDETDSLTRRNTTPEYLSQLHLSPLMSALGQKQTFAVQNGMSALPRNSGHHPRPAGDE